MCGIAGLIYATRSRPDPDLVGKLSRVLEHRGPDDHGWLLSDGERVQSGRGTMPDALGDVVLVHRRLSILDLSEAGWQPMSSASGHLHITFNGEIYNYIELRQELIQLGHHFRTRTDTEVLLAAYDEWGAAAFSRLVGMFAFGLLDLRNRELLLVRDFFGIKPLYYAAWKEGLAFASETTALLELPGIDRLVDPQQLYDYLRFGLTDHGPATLLSAVRQIPPAHYLTLALDTHDEPALTRYWTPGETERSSLSFRAAAERLQELFLTSIRLHLRSDVPVGAALSGGLDSSAIVMAMRAVEPTLDLRAYSYVSEDPATSEEPWIDIVGRDAQARITKVRASASEMAADLRTVMSNQGEPFGGASIYAQHRVFKAARADGVTVMLDGQGADEILGGYRYYLAARLTSLWRQRRFGEIHRFLTASSRLPGVTRLGLVARAADFAIPAAYQDPARRLVGKTLVPKWMRAEWFAQRGVIPPTLCYSRSNEALHEHLRRTLASTSLPHLLRYEDRNSMAFSIESRVPFLTPQLVDFVLSLPEEYLISPTGESKAVFRQAMRGIVPDAILDRKDKIGFATPQGSWLNAAGEWVSSLLSSEQARMIAPLDAAGVQREWAAARRGAADTGAVWRWLNLIEWSGQVGARYE